MIDQWNGVPHVRANPYCTGYCMSCVFNWGRGVWQCVVQCHAIHNFGLWMVLGYNYGYTGIPYTPIWDNAKLTYTVVGCSLLNVHHSSLRCFKRCWVIWIQNTARLSTPITECHPNCHRSIPALVPDLLVLHFDAIPAPATACTDHRSDGCPRVNGGPTS